MNKRICGIYRIENTINGKSYIGYSVNVFDRWKSHLRLSTKKTNRSRTIHAAIAKHGTDNFIFSIVEECKKEDLQDREKFWISKYNSYHHGYNETLGGDGGTYSASHRKKISASRIGIKYTEAEKENFSRKMKERWLDPEYIERVGSWRKDKKKFDAWLKKKIGKKHPEESKLLRRKFWTEDKRKEWSRRSKIQYIKKMGYMLCN